MKEIWKFPIESQSNPIIINMPEGAIIRDFQTQSVPKPNPLGEPPKKQSQIVTIVRDLEVPTIWAEVDLNSTKTEERKFWMVGTGILLRADFPYYIGTTQMYQGALVLHLYSNRAYNNQEPK